MKEVFLSYLIAGILLVCFSLVILSVSALAIYVSKDVAGIRKHQDLLESEMQMISIEYRDMLEQIHKINSRMNGSKAPKETE